MENLTLTLCYGYVESEDGIHHAFEPVDETADDIDYTNITSNLARTLATTTDDPLFHADMISVTIPKSMVTRIQNMKTGKEAISE